MMQSVTLKIWNQAKRISKNSAGLYTLEGAFSITIFAGLFMMLLSLIAIMRVEMVVQYAINETAMQISQYAYVGESIKSKDRTLGICASAGGPAVCKSLAKSNFHRSDIDSWLERQGVERGYDGLTFSASRLLDGDSDVSIVVIYKLKLSAFGNSDRCLTICQKAQTSAWLNAADKKALEESESTKSIWQKKSFERGKYFVRKIKAENLSAAVKSGQGIDLYYKTERRIAEVYSMHVFMPSYCYVKAESEENFSAESYTPDYDSIFEQIMEYADKFNLDIENTERLIEMEDGSLGNFGRLNEKELILVVPKEAEGLDAFSNAFRKVAVHLKRDKNITLIMRYCEEAFT